jgi:squalene synthase HpnC
VLGSPRPSAADHPRLRERERGENFPVALRVLPADLRADLHAVYAVVRTIDDLGDDAEGDRTAALEAFAVDLATVWSTGRPRSPVLAGLVPTVTRRNLTREPFDRLIAANLRDQRVTRYATFAELLDYCALSAAPIGRIVLAVFGRSTPERVALSDRVCAGLQVVEHLQDIAEDRARGRVYLPTADLREHGVTEADLDAPAASPALRRLVHAELRRVEGLLDAGPRLVAGLSGWPRLAVAGYVAGGRAAVAGVRRVDGDVLARRAQVRRRDVLRALLTTLPAGSSPMSTARGAAAC